MDSKKDKFFSYLRYGAIAIALTYPFLAFYLDYRFGADINDTGFFRYLGWRFSSGDGGFANAWDCKGPSLVLFNAIPFWLFKDWMPGTSAFFAAIWSFMLFLFCKLIRNLNQKFAEIATLSLILLINPMMFLDCQEVIALLFGCAGLLLINGNPKSFHCILFGLCVAIPFMAKANTAMFCVSVGAMWLYDLITTCKYGLFLKRITFSFIGFALAIVIFCVIFYSSGLYDMWDAALLYNLFERSMGIKVGWLEWWRQFLNANFTFKSPVWLRLLIWSFLCFAGMIVGTVFAIRNNCCRKQYVALLTWLLLEFLMAIVSKGFYEHYTWISYAPLICLIFFVIQHERNYFCAKAILLVPLVFLAVGGSCICACRSIWPFVHGRGEVIRADCIRQVIPKGANLVSCGNLVTPEVLVRLHANVKQKYFCWPMYFDRCTRTRKEAMVKEFSFGCNDVATKFLVSDYTCDEIASMLCREGYAGVTNSLSAFELVFDKIQCGVYIYRKRQVGENFEKRDSVRSNENCGRVRSDNQEK